MNETQFLMIKGTCDCGCDSIMNLRHFVDGLFTGWWAECLYCKSTRFLPEKLVLKTEKKVA